MTEVSVPFTNFQIEDAILVDQHHLMALECAFFYPDGIEEESESKNTGEEMKEEEQHPKNAGYIQLKEVKLQPGVDTSISMMAPGHAGQDGSGQPAELI